MIFGITCDMPVGFDLAVIGDQAKEAIGTSYPHFRKQMRSQANVLMPKSQEKPEIQDFSCTLQALQFSAGNKEKPEQIVQFHGDGFTFHRLAPYMGMDAYIEEIHRTWNAFAKIAKPVKIRKVELRTINRFFLPMEGNTFKVGEYFRQPRWFIDVEGLTHSKFFDNREAYDDTTKNQVSATLSVEGMDPERGVPVIFDIDTLNPLARDIPESWEEMMPIINSLRELKNRVFYSTLTESCLNLFR